MAPTAATHGQGMFLVQFIEQLAGLEPDTVVVDGFDDPHGYTGAPGSLAFRPTGPATAGKLAALAGEAMGQWFTDAEGGLIRIRPISKVWMAAPGEFGRPVVGVVEIDGQAELLLGLDVISDEFRGL